MKELTTHVELLWDRPVSPNLDAGNATVACAYARATQLDDGRIVCVYRQAKTKHSHDGKLVTQSSNDGGQSWSEPETLFKRIESSPTETVVSGGVCAIGKDRLLATVGTMVDLKPDVYMFADDAAHLRRRVYAMVSDDAGRNWTAPVALDTHPYRRAGITSNPMVLPNGAIGIPLEVATDIGVHATVMTFARETEGQWTFEPLAPCAADPAGELNLCDAQFTQLQDGRVLMHLWTFRQQDEETIDAHQSTSADAGRTWSFPQPTGIQGQITVPLALSSDVVIAVSNYRRSPPGIYLWMSRDGARSWDTSPVRMWDEMAKKLTADPTEIVPSKSEDEGVWEQLQLFTFGTPGLLKLADETVLMTYYATINEIIHVRACRLRIL